MPLDTDGYETLILTGTTGRTYTLPAAANNTDRELQFINNGTSNAVLTLARAGSDTIGPGAETAILLSFQGDSIRLKSDGTNWLFVGQYFQSQRFTTAPTSGAGASPTSPVIHVVRRGRSVSVFVKVTTDSSGATGDILWTGLLSAWARPTVTYTQIHLHSVGSNLLYFTQMTNGGSPTLQRRALADTVDALTTSNFDNSTEYNGQMTYLIGE